MSYHGYDPFNSIGAPVSTTLTGHTVLLAAFNESAPQFNLYLSDIHGDGGTAFKTLKVYNGPLSENPALIATYEVSDSTHTNVGAVTLNSVIYPAVETYTWAQETDIFDGVTTFTLVFEYFTAEEVGEDIQGLIQWPHLDMGALGVEKALVGLDVIATAPEGLSVSVGYDQRDLSQRTTPYLIDADTLPGQLIPIPVSGPSFDLQITFEPNQEWQWDAANLYIQDQRPGS